MIRNMFRGDFRKKPFKKSLGLISVTGIIMYIINIENLGFSLLLNFKIKIADTKGTDHPFVFIKTSGRLGNQMFEYACGYTLAKKNKVPFLLTLPQDIVEDPKYPDGIFNVEGTFHLHFFKIPLLAKEEYDRLQAMTEEDTSLIQILMDKDIMSGNYPRNKILKVEDYCQSEHMFLPYRDEIRAFFRLREPYLEKESIHLWEQRIEEAKKNRETVCVHIRRGDFVTTQNRLVDISFYTNAMQEINQLVKTNGKTTPEFFLFSDEINYIKEYFDEEKFKKSVLTPHSTSIWIEGIETHVILNWVSGSFPNMSSIEDFHLLSKCHHNILSGSSFGWWGAYLNDYKEQIVIAAHYSPQVFKWWWNPTKQFQYRHFYYPIGWIVKDVNFVN